MIFIDHLTIVTVTTSISTVTTILVLVIVYYRHTALGFTLKLIKRLSLWSFNDSYFSSVTVLLLGMDSSWTDGGYYCTNVLACTCSCNKLKLLCPQNDNTSQNQFSLPLSLSLSLHYTFFKPV